MEARLSEFISLQQEATNESTSCDRLFELARSTELARLVAKNPSASPSLLQELGDSSDATTRENVAANPNTPTDVLLKLGAEFPEQMLDNPVFSLLLLENPNLVDEMPKTTLRSILKQERVPVYFLERAADKSDLEVQLAVVMNAQTPRVGLAKLVQSQNPQVASSAGLHINWAGEMTEGWDEAARKAIQSIAPTYTGDLYNLGVYAQIGVIPEFMVKPWREERNCKEFLKALAESVNTTAGVLEQLAQHDNLEIRLAVALNPNTPAYTLEKMAAEDSIVLSGVAENPNTPPSILEQLAEDKNSLVRSGVARNPNTPVNLLEQLLRDNDHNVRQGVAWNPNVPLLLLEQWIKLVDGSVVSNIALNPIAPVHFLERLAMFRCPAVALNPNTPAYILEQYSRDKEAEIRALVAQNPNTPTGILEHLAQDENILVRKNVAKNPNTPVRVLLGKLARDAQVQQVVVEKIECRGIHIWHKSTPWQIKKDKSRHDSKITVSIRHLLTEISNTPESLLEKFARHEKPNVRYFVSQLPEAPANLLEQLAWDEYTDIRRVVAKHPNTPGNTLEQLLKDKEHSVCKAVAENPSLPESILVQLLSKEVVVRRYLDQNPDGLPVVLERYAESSSFLSRLIVLLHPQTPTIVLTEKSLSYTWLERYAVAQNPSTPLNALKALAKDGNRIVRAAARANLRSRSQQP